MRINEDEQDIEDIIAALINYPARSALLFGAQFTSLDTAQDKTIQPPIKEMIDWFIRYIDNPSFIASYKRKGILELLAEATFLSVELDLKHFLEKMTFEEIKNFKPIKEATLKKSERGYLLEAVISKLTRPVTLSRASMVMTEVAEIFRRLKGHEDSAVNTSFKRKSKL